MHHFFLDRSCIDLEKGIVTINGENYRHLMVLRARENERILISDGISENFECLIESINENEIIARIDEKSESKELPCEVWLYQGIPKMDRMELIVQKAVELGAVGIVPVITKNTIARPDEKKKEKKADRWQKIAASAADQSKRSILPEVKSPISWKEAIKELKDFDVFLIPYEAEDDRLGSRKNFDRIKTLEPGKKIGIFIGPEGGFDPREIEEAIKNGACSITLGKRILRTETASITALSAVMLMLEGLI